MKCSLKPQSERYIRAQLWSSRVGPTSSAGLDEGVSFEVLELLLEELLNISVRRRGNEISEVAFEEPAALGFLYPRAGIKIR